MSPPNGSIMTPTVVASLPAITILLSNLRLLDLDKREDWPNISTHTFNNRDSTQTQKTRIQCVEWITYHVYQIWDPVECQEKLRPFYPPFEPLQSINLRAALFRCLNELKKNGVLGGDIYLRKSMFDECKNDTILKTLSAFSTVTLHKVISSDPANSKSVAARLSLAENVPTDECSFLLPMTIAHRSSLSSGLRKRRISKARYRDLSNAMENKDQDLARKFENVVETQEFLDQIPPSENTVERASKVFGQHWQGDRNLLHVVAQGEDHRMSDALLDGAFETLWHKAGTGEYDGQISINQNGLLHDLEKRVAMQQARLGHWKDFRKNLERGRIANQNTPVSPSKQKQLSPKSLRYEQRKEKDLVFSPRKSPRKSMWPEPSSNNLATLNNEGDEASHALAFNNPPFINSSPLAAKPIGVLEFVSGGTPINSSFDDDHDESSFSEISAKELDRSQIHYARGLDSGNNHSGTATTTPADARIDNTTPINSPIAGTSPVMVRTPDNLTCEDGSPFTKPSEDEGLAKRLISIALNATLTPGHLDSSLVQRTRRSMASASPKKQLSNTVPPSLSPLVLSPEGALPVRALTAATLAERTRQSISLVPARPKRSRDSMHTRRTSQAFPTNQFETPKKQSGILELTPPEELMSPRAGYDSVFKSRPKVAVSPTTSPCPEYPNAGGLEQSDD